MWRLSPLEGTRQVKSCQSVYNEFDDGSRIVVWLTVDVDDVNTVLEQLLPIEDNELHLVPFPPPPAPLGRTGGKFIVGDTIYGTLEAGYECKQCKTQVEGGTWARPHPHRFDFCRCVVAIRAPDSEWNSILIDQDNWQDCISMISEARKGPHYR
jgi:hypothetical protein